MQANLIDCTNLGMVRDTAISKISGDKAEFAYDNRNIRITVNQDNTALSVTNEKGTESALSINGVLLGLCILNNQLVLFIKDTSSQIDRIIKIIENNNKYEAKYLYSGNLNFNLDYPIETLGYYESENVLKVYWVDGLNSTRFINIASTNIQANNDTQFDCKGTIYKVPNVTITKDYSEVGNFIGGTVQYFITYYNKFGTETGIVWQSDLQYTTKYDRGCKEGEQAQCVFKLNISNIDTTNYDYLRIYATHRSSKNSTPLTYIVADLETSTLNNTITYTDDGVGLTAFPTGDLNFIGGLTIIASTLDLKDDTLFLGDITLPKTIIPTDSNLYKALTNLEEVTYESGNVIVPTSSKDISFSHKSLPTPEFKNTYSHKNQLDESQEEIAGFKYREVYRFAILFQTSKGEWTNPIYIGDKYCNLSPQLENGTYLIALAQYTMNPTAVAELTKWNSDSTHDEFINVRLLVAEVTNLDRRILAQGVVNPTMFNYYDRILNKPYSINSWMFRPRQSLLTNRHYDCMLELSSLYAEILGITKKHIPGFDPTEVDTTKENSYALLIGLSGDWITNHLIAYVLYKYANDGLIDFYEPSTDPEGNTVQIINDKQGRHNKLEKEAIVRIPKDDNGKPINFKTKDKARLWLVENLAADLGMTDAMIPTAQELKEMARASLTTDNPDLIWSIIGASLATVASVVVTCLTFGAGAPLAGLGAAGVWSGVIAAMGTVGAAAGTSGVATLANQLKDAPDIDRIFAEKGFYTLLPEFKHSLKNKGNFKDQYSEWLDGLFREADENGKYIGTKQEPDTTFITYLKEGDNKATLLLQVGRLSFKTPKELDAETKREQYYIDESIVTLNSPDLEDNQYTIDGSQALKLDLIGTIPITAVQGDVSMYTATNGVLSNASTLNSAIAKPYSTTNVEGLINGPLYQDMQLNWTFDPEDKWPDISPGRAVDSYKIFMWNRDTSWSCYIPGVNIINPMSIAIDNTIKEGMEKDYINYIPAIPKKKVIANLRYSHNTTYQNSIHTLDIESPHIFIQGYDGITPFYSNDTYRTYYGNVHNLSINTDGYVLLKGNDLPAWTQPEDHASKKYIYDPISIKFNSTDHVLVPLKWDEKLKLQTILPSLNNNLYNIENYYPITPKSIIEGFGRNDSKPIERISIPSTDVSGSTSSGNNFPLLMEGETPYYTTKQYTFTANTLLTIGCNEFNIETSEVDAKYLEIANEQSGEDYVGISCSISTLDGNVIINGIVSKQNQTSIQVIVGAGDYIIKYAPVGYCIVKEFDENHPAVSASATLSGELVILQSDYFVNSYDILTWTEPNPYLFIGELVKQNTDYKNWLGGVSQQALELLTWNICSLNVPIDGTNVLIFKTWGDTYYQRWDCMKTFPTTEEDKNSVVDILSFMVESHLNLDGRCDVNRGVTNLVNARPTNFNLFNDAYTQPDNLFQYKILDTKFEDNTQENQVVWSLTKNILDDIDKWTQINTVNYLNLNGTYGRLRKIINVNDILLAFQDTGISTINYNQKAAISTVEGIPVQLGNTNKVDGYTTVSDKIGCHNKWSINLNSTGLYFIDDYNQSLNKYSTLNGIESISNLQGFTQWFKDNINGTIWTPQNYTAFKLSFDELTKDLYIINDTEALVYNALLQRFISFMDYPKCPLITNLQLNSIALYQNGSNLELYKMFKGAYNNLLGKQQPYWMTYRLNPSAYTDNLFTNFTYIADIIPSLTSLDNTNITNTAHQTFTSVEAWNEYQHGTLDLTTVKNRHKGSKDRFRIWRGDIPRDGDTSKTHINGGNRMRNPWLYLKLYKDTTRDTDKMVFHNLTVTYYK